MKHGIKTLPAQRVQIAPSKSPTYTPLMKPSMSKNLSTLLLFAFSGSVLSAPPPFADIHLHFNWDQKEIISAQEVVKRLKANNVVLATVSNTYPGFIHASFCAGLWIRLIFLYRTSVRS